MVRHYKCNRDLDCSPVTGRYYCSQQSVCEKCFPCNLVNRQASPCSPECARSAEDCGPCLPSYKAEDLTLGRTAFECFKTEERIDKPASFTDSVDDAGEAMILTVSVIPIGLVSVLMILVMLRKKGVFDSITRKSANVNDGAGRYQLRSDIAPGDPEREQVPLTDPPPSYYEAMAMMSYVSISVHRVRDIGNIDETHQQEPYVSMKESRSVEPIQSMERREWLVQQAPAPTHHSQLISSQSLLVPSLNSQSPE